MCVSVYFINMVASRNKFECNDTYIGMKLSFKKTHVCGVSNNIGLKLAVNKDM